MCTEMGLRSQHRLVPITPGDDTCARGAWCQAVVSKPKCVFVQHSGWSAFPPPTLQLAFNVHLVMQFLPAAKLLQCCGLPVTKQSAMIWLCLGNNPPSPTYWQVWLDVQQAVLTIQPKSVPLQFSHFNHTLPMRKYVVDCYLRYGRHLCMA